jgi:hypothetical protein
VKLSFGSGEKRSPGFVHLDGQPYPGIDIVHVWSPSNPVPLPDGSVDEVLLALDVLEHFSRHTAPELVKEWSRLCAPGCVLILTTIEIHRMMSWLREIPGEELDVIEGLYCRQNFAGNWHLWCYSRASLRDLLQRYGFVVEKFQEAPLYRGNVICYARRGPNGWQNFDADVAAQR